MRWLSKFFGEKNPKEEAVEISEDIDSLNQLENSGFKEMLLSLESKLVLNKTINENYIVTYAKGKNRNQEGIFLSLTPRNNYQTTGFYELETLLMNSQELGRGLIYSLG